MELIPAIANYFGVAIDELFGYNNDRDRKIDAIIQEIDAFHIKSRGDEVNDGSVYFYQKSSKERTGANYSAWW